MCSFIGTYDRGRGPRRRRTRRRIHCILLLLKKKKIHVFVPYITVIHSPVHVLWVFSIRRYTIYLLYVRICWYIYTCIHVTYRVLGFVKTYDCLRLKFFFFFYINRLELSWSYWTAPENAHRRYYKIDFFALPSSYRTTYKIDLVRSSTFFQIAIWSTASAIVPYRHPVNV